MILETFIKICPENQNTVTIGQKYRALHEDIDTFIVVGDIKQPYKLSLRPKWYQTV
jgi:hypothetical protein